MTTPVYNELTTQALKMPAFILTTENPVVRKKFKDAKNSDFLLDYIEKSSQLIQVDMQARKAFGTPAGKGLSSKELFKLVDKVEEQAKDFNMFLKENAPEVLKAFEQEQREERRKKEKENPAAQPSERSLGQLSPLGFQHSSSQSNRQKIK